MARRASNRSNSNGRKKPVRRKTAATKFRDSINSLDLRGSINIPIGDAQAIDILRDVGYDLQEYSDAYLGTQLFDRHTKPSQFLAYLLRCMSDQVNHPWMLYEKYGNSGSYELIYYVDTEYWDWPKLAPLHWIEEVYKRSRSLFGVVLRLLRYLHAVKYIPMWWSNISWQIHDEWKTKVKESYYEEPTLSELRAEVEEMKGFPAKIEKTIKDENFNMINWWERKAIKERIDRMRPKGSFMNLVKKWLLMTFELMDCLDYRDWYQPDIDYDVSALNRHYNDERADPLDLVGFCWKNDDNFTSELQYIMENNQDYGYFRRTLQIPDLQNLDKYNEQYNIYENFFKLTHEIADVYNEELSIRNGTKTLIDRL